jgi:hypothetical protein
MMTWNSITRALAMWQQRTGVDQVDAKGRTRSWDALEEVDANRPELLRRIRCITRHPASHINGSDAVKQLETFALALEAEDNAR